MIASNITTAAPLATDTLAATQVIPAPAQQVMHISTSTFVSAMQNAFSTARYSILLELSAGMALFLESGGITNDTKTQLQNVYTAAGHLSENPNSPEYKSVRRKISLTVLLYQFITPNKLQEWIGGGYEMMAISAVVAQLEMLNIRTYDSVLVLVGKPRQAPKPRVSQAVAVTPAEEPPTEQQAAVDEAFKHVVKDEQIRYGEWLVAKHQGAIEGDFEFLPADQAGPPRRRSTDIEEGAVTVNTEHLHISIPENTSKDELMRAALEMIALAQSLTNSSVVGDLPKAVVEEALHPTAKEETQEEPEDEAATKEHMQMEAERLEREAISAKKTPITPAPSRFRKPTAKK